MAEGAGSGRRLTGELISFAAGMGSGVVQPSDEERPSIIDSSALEVSIEAVQSRRTEAT